MTHAKHPLQEPIATPEVRAWCVTERSFLPDYLVCSGEHCAELHGRPCPRSEHGRMPLPVPLSADDPGYSTDKGQPGDLCPACCESHLTSLEHWQGHGGHIFPNTMLPLRVFKCSVVGAWWVIPGLSHASPTKILHECDPGREGGSLSQRLHRFFWSDAMNPFLEQLTYAWCDGGCWICADALFRYVLLSETVEPSAISYMIVADAWHPAEHVVVCLSLEGQCWYLDANGVSSETELLGYWRQEERCGEPFLVEFDPLLLLEEGIPRNPQMSKCLADLLFEAFGPFSPRWLEQHHP